MGDKWRIEVEVLVLGQSDEYRNITNHVRITFEQNHKGIWKPSTGWSDFMVRSILRGIPCGFTDEPPRDWASTRLDWLKNTAPGVWEFHTTTPFTD